MADRKISELTQITGANVDDANDEIAIVDTSASETKAITRGELFSGVASGSFDGDVTVGGNLTVNGTTVTIDTTTLDVADKNITIAKDAPDAATADGAGLTVDGANATITYDSTDDTWDFNKGISTTGDIEVTGTVDGRDVAADGSKLDGIESNATADQTASEIKTAYESNADTNAFTDAEQTKLSNVETNADVTDTANVTAAGALMDSELTSEASVKALDQGVATTDSPDFAGLTVDTDTLYVDSANNRVGIGTNNPASIAHINGDDAVLIIQDSDANNFTTNQSQIHFKTSTNVVGLLGYESDSDEHLSIKANGGSSAIKMFAGNSERMRIDGSGDVGIGTSSPVSIGSFIPTLDLKGQSNSRSGAVRFSSNNESSSAGLYFVNNQFNVSTFTADAILFKTNNSERMRIDSSGRVGIGTSSPSEELHVVGTVISTGGRGTGFGYKTADWQIYNSSDFGLVFDNNSEAMRIDSSGNVGIGLTNSDFTFGVENSSVDTLQRNRRSGTTTGPSRFPLTNFVGASSTDSSGTSVAGFGVGFKTRYNDSQEFYTGAILGHHYVGFKGGLHFYVQTTGGAPGVDSSGQGTGSTGSANTPDSLTNALTINNLGNTTPGADNSFDLGASSLRFDDIYATNGTIQTSDRNEKQDIEALSDAEQRVAVACKGLLRKFRWKGAVAEKGDDARIHFGIIAQDLQAAFEAEGLNAGRYAMFIHSEWTDEKTGEQRSRMGVRYSELLAFIIAAI